MHIWLLQHITLYQRRQKITSLNTIEFLDTRAFINNPLWQSSGILIFLCKFYIVVSDTLVGSFLDVFFIACCNNIRTSWGNQKVDIELQKKVHRGICVRDITFLTARSPFNAFLLLSSSTPFPFPNDALVEWPLDTYIAMGGILVMISWVNGWKFENL